MKNILYQLFFCFVGAMVFGFTLIIGLACFSIAYANEYWIWILIASFIFMGMVCFGFNLSKILIDNIYDEDNENDI
jgi:glucan phosphoethanolaminetransferase (alkaline phosphatase superfamily)